MGWLDYHLHAFHVQDPHSATTVEIGIPDEKILPGENPVLAGWEAPVRSYLNEAGQAVNYEYDLEMVGNIRSCLRRSCLMSEVLSIQFVWVVNARARRKTAEESGDIKR